MKFWLSHHITCLSGHNSNFLVPSPHGHPFLFLWNFIFLVFFPCLILSLSLPSFPDTHFLQSIFYEPFCLFAFHPISLLGFFLNFLLFEVLFVLHNVRLFLPSFRVLEYSWVFVSIEFCAKWGSTFYHRQIHWLICSFLFVISGVTWYWWWRKKFFKKLKKVEMSETWRCSPRTKVVLHWMSRRVTRILPDTWMKCSNHLRPTEIPYTLSCPSPFFMPPYSSRALSVMWARV